MPRVATGSGAIDVMSKLLQDRILMLNGQAQGWWMVAGDLGYPDATHKSNAFFHRFSWEHPKKTKKQHGINIQKA